MNIELYCVWINRVYRSSEQNWGSWKFGFQSKYRDQVQIKWFWSNVDPKYRLRFDQNFLLLNLQRQIQHIFFFSILIDWLLVQYSASNNLVNFKQKDIDTCCWSTQNEYMMVKFSSVIQQNIVAPKTMLNRLNFDQNYNFTGGWVGGWVGVGGWINGE